MPRAFLPGDHSVTTAFSYVVQLILPDLAFFYMNLILEDHPAALRGAMYHLLADGNLEDSQWIYRILWPFRSRSPQMVVWLDMRSLSPCRSRDLANYSIFSHTQLAQPSEAIGAEHSGSSSSQFAQLDRVLLISLGFCHARFVWFPTESAKLAIPSTYINFDLLYHKTNSQFPPIEGLTRALAQVSAAEVDKVYP
jgi:hypothetical protein